MRTVENLAAEILGSTVIDTDGLTVTHSLGAMRLLTQADLGIAAAGALRVGTDGGNVEITAGEVEAPDPAFTVVPDCDVPGSPPEVDTARPREPTHGIKEIWESVWLGLEVALEATGIYHAQHGRPPQSVASHALGIIAEVSSAYGVAHAAIQAAIEAALAAAHVAEEGESEEPQVLVHGAGGVHLSSSHEVEAFGGSAVVMHSPVKVAVEAGTKAVMKSPVYAAVFGGLMASLKSEGVALVHGHHAGLGGHTAEVRGHEVVSLASNEKALVQSGGQTSVTAERELALGGRDVHASAASSMHLSGYDAELRGQNVASVRCGAVGSDSAMLLMDRTSLSLRSDNGGNEIELSQNEIRLKPGGRQQLVASRDEVKVGQHVSVKRGEVSIRAPRINLG